MPENLISYAQNTYLNVSGGKIKSNDILFEIIFFLHKTMYNPMIIRFELPPRFHSKMCVNILWGQNLILTVMRKDFS